MECFTCKSLSGERPLFPESKMYDGKYWIVEHAFPVKIKGWLVIILKRHAEALHELIIDEFRELITLQEKLTKILHQELHSLKEYSVCFAEGKNFNHIHVHIIARSKDVPLELKGPHIFSLLKTDEKHSIPKDEILKLSSIIKKKLTSAKSSR